MSSEYWLRNANRRVGRRRFLASTTAAAGGFAALTAVGCGDDDDDDDGGSASPTGAPSAAATETPVKGGVLRQWGYSEPVNFDPHQTGTLMTQHVQSPIYNGLLRYKYNQPEAPPDAIEADLAEKWEQPDPLTLVFTLRKGIKFHNGSPFTSADVKANYDWIQNPPAGKVSLWKEPFTNVTAIATPDDSTVRLTLAKPSASFTLLLASMVYAIHEGKLLTTQGGIINPPVGTGPMKFKGYEKGVAIEHERNPEYFRQGTPHLDGAKWLIIADQNSARTNFIGGQMDHYWALSRGPEDLDPIKSALGDKAEYVIKQSVAGTGFYLNQTRAEFKDARVRQAIQMALVRAEHIQLLSQGTSKPGGFMSPIGPWAYPAADLAKFPGYGPLNVNDAKALLSAAGASSLKLTITASSLQAQAELIQQELQKIGVSATLDITDLATHTTRMNARQFESSNFSVSPPADEPDATFARTITGGAPNYSGISDSNVDALYQKQGTILDAKERKTVVNELEKAALGLYANAVVHYSVFSYAKYKSVRELYESGIATSGGRQLESTWLKA